MSEWDEYAADWDTDEMARAYAAAAHTALLTLLDEYTIPLDGARVLDFGCGTGLLTERLVASGATVLAVDTSPAMLDVLNSKSLDRVSTSTTLPAETGSIDVIVCSSVCSFLPDYPATALELVALLRPGGLFVQWDWERDDADAEPHGLHRSEINAALTDAGLGEVRVGVGFEAAVDETVMRPLMGSGRA